MPQPGSGLRQKDPFDRVAHLALIALGRPQASVTIAGSDSSGPIWGASQRSDAEPGPAERSMRQQVVDSGRELIIDDAATGQPAGPGRGESGGLMAWAGFPVRDPDGRTVGALCVADHRARPWSSSDVAVLADLAHVASEEVALRTALRLGSERAVLARTLQQILLPPRLPKIPGLQVAARYRPAGPAPRYSATSTTSSRPPGAAGDSSSGTSAAAASPRPRAPCLPATRCAAKHSGRRGR
ncbi:MAG TPA: GAF domain-containing protein, partial [Streptosporangiaceae bacterium]|nr:GAF domain-containing protein [Streptosporangiaceae bacterium]